MADMMTFPDTVEEFMEQYKITDTEQIYTNGAELVPIFRMRQWFDHKPESCEDAVSRKEVLTIVEELQARAGKLDEGLIRSAVEATLKPIREITNRLPAAQPEIIHCKDCKHHFVHRCMDSIPTEICDLNQTFYDAEVDFCSLAERRTG